MHVLHNLSLIISSLLHFPHPPFLKKKNITDCLCDDVLPPPYHLHLEGEAGDTQTVYAPCGDL